MAAPGPILPEKGRRNILITSALPYVNNVPHLGNIIGSTLSADVYARFCRQKGYNTIYICGTDEYGTATETKAMAEGTTPQEICDRYHKVHAQVYEWFEIGFDHFGRTTTPEQTDIAQDIFHHIKKNDYLIEEESQQLYCEKDSRFLADRLVEGECPHCQYNDARGDQCDKCAKLLNPTELINPRCQACGTAPVVRSTRHLYIDLPKLTPALTAWVEKREASGQWSANAVATTRTWLRDGLRPRAITRDLKWGTPVPLEEYKNKVFYVWFDAPIGYISITATYTKDWKQWWLNPENNVELVQFMGKDNTPFHTVVFPSSLLATQQPWTTLHGLSTTEYLNYEQGKFSKSRNRGIFGDQVQSTGLSPDIWRYYLLSIRPEGADTDFSWDELRIKINADLADNVGNLINRGLKIVGSTFGSKVPEKTDGLTEADQKVIDEINVELKTYETLMEDRKLRDGLKSVMAIARLGNGFLQKNAPWELAKSDLKRCATVLIFHCSLVKHIAILMHPFVPGLSRRILAQLGFESASLDLPAAFQWDSVPSGHAIGNPEPLVPRLDAAKITALRAQFTPEAAVAAQESFLLDLRVGKVVEVAEHPGSDNLYLLKVDLGTEQRQVVSGIRAQYTKEDLQNRQVIVVCNLAESKFRGEVSQGMLLTIIKDGQIGLLGLNAEVPIGTVVKPDNHTVAAKPKFDAKKVKGLPWKYMATGILFNKEFVLKAAEHPVVVSIPGSWEGGLVQ